MNTDLKDLRVAVIPSETGNDIDQSSSYEEIINCKEVLFFSVPDYFKAQNDEVLPHLHWSFLIDVTKEVDCTDMNVDGLDYFSEETIKYLIRKQVLTNTNMKEEGKGLNYWKGNAETIKHLTSKQVLTEIGNDTDQFIRKVKISEIEDIISKWGEVTSQELELEASPIIAFIEHHKDSVSQLVERFRSGGVDAITYLGEQEIGGEYLTYLTLSNELIDEIYDIMQEYDTRKIIERGSFK